MFVRDRMSSPAVTITPDKVLRDALRLMHQGHFRRLPVIDESGKLVGIVSEADLSQTSPSRPGSLSVWDLNRVLSRVQIREVMTEEVMTTTADVPVEDVARLMTENRVGGLPVLDGEDHVIGVITETDIFKAFVEMFAGGHSGLRLTLEIPQTKDVLRELTKTISELGGNIVSVGSFYSDATGRRGLVVKIRGARKDQLVDTLEALGDHVVDARDV
jgi:acetoin utilization protein AcuB